MTLRNEDPSYELYFLSTMVRRKSLEATELENRLAEAILGVQNKTYKSPYEAAKALGLSKRTVTRRVNGGNSRIEARQKQQHLTKTQEQTLLKWIKHLTASGYAPSHRILREVADEIRTKRNRVFVLNEPFQHSEEIHSFPLGQDWVLRFVQRHPQLQVRQGRRIEAQR